jgi:hypothetical protein
MWCQLRVTARPTFIAKVVTAPRPATGQAAKACRIAGLRQGSKVRGWPVSRILWRLASPMASHLGPSSPAGSCSQPGPLGQEYPGGEPPRDPYLALLQAGLAMPPALPPARWALTPPFHPCPRAEALGRSDLCGAFPRVTPGGRYPPPCLPGVRTFLDPCGPRPSGHPRGPSLTREPSPGQRRPAAPPAGGHRGLAAPASAVWAGPPPRGASSPRSAGAKAPGAFAGARCRTWGRRRKSSALWPESFSPRLLAGPLVLPDRLPASMIPEEGGAAQARPVTAATSAASGAAARAQGRKRRRTAASTAPQSPSGAP